MLPTNDYRWQRKKNGTTDKNYYTKITRKKSIKKIKFANRGESLEVKVTVYKNDK